MNGFTKVKGPVWRPEDNDMPPHCPTDDGSYILTMTNGQGIWSEYNPVPTGVIWPFYGYENEIEEGWTLCDGEGVLSNGRPVPDLRERFLMMAGDDKAVGNTGGSTEVRTSAAGSHYHSVTVLGHRLTVDEMPAHSHEVNLKDWKADGNTSSIGSGLRGGIYNSPPNGETTNTTGRNESHRHGSTCSMETNHAHDVTITPPFYSLAFIIKL